MSDLGNRFAAAVNKRGSQHIGQFIWAALADAGLGDIHGGDLLILSDQTLVEACEQYAVRTQLEVDGSTAYIKYGEGLEALTAHFATPSGAVAHVGSLQETERALGVTDTTWCGAADPDSAEQEPASGHEVDFSTLGIDLTRGSMGGTQQVKKACASDDGRDAGD